MLPGGPPTRKRRFLFSFLNESMLGKFPFLLSFPPEPGSPPPPLFSLVVVGVCCRVSGGFFFPLFPLSLELLPRPPGRKPRLAFWGTNEHPFSRARFCVDEWHFFMARAGIFPFLPPLSNPDSRRNVPLNSHIERVQCSFLPSSLPFSCR